MISVAEQRACHDRVFSVVVIGIERRRRLLCCSLAQGFAVAGQDRCHVRAIGPEGLDRAGLVSEGRGGQCDQNKKCVLHGSSKLCLRTGLGACKNIIPWILKNTIQLRILRMVRLKTYVMQISHFVCCEMCTSISAVFLNSLYTYLYYINIYK